MNIDTVVQTLTILAIVSLGLLALLGVALGAANRLPRDQASMRTDDTRLDSMAATPNLLYSLKG